LFLIATASLHEASIAAPALSGFPFTDEDLAYTVNWPSGLSLGEGHLRAKHSGANWNFELTIDAGIPGFSVKDDYRSIADANFCSLEFDRTSVHGTRNTDEQEKFDIQNGTVTRVTLNGGGQSELHAGKCVRDALTFLFFARRELGQGRVPQTQDIVFGGLYHAQLQYAGAPVISVNEKQVQSDSLTSAIKGTAPGSSEIRFDMYFARDAARTPLLFKVPLPLGAFSMELVR
jgi:hypothetical protein